MSAAADTEPIAFLLPPPWVRLSTRRSLRKQRPRCGARTRTGAPCQAPAVWDAGSNRPRNGRCRMHGGLSTGPTSTEGREKIADAQRRRWDAWRQRRAGGEQC